MKALSEFKNPGVQFVFTDIDDTLTEDGKLGAAAYEALWKLHRCGLKVIPVTGRPAGWCELIARQWPVAGVIGENGGFYFRHIKEKAGAPSRSAMKREFLITAVDRESNAAKLNKIRDEVLSSIPGAAVASDQFCRMMDLAIDFCEDVPALSPAAIAQIVSVFEKHGAQAKVSSIHVNGWFGDYNKLSMCKIFMLNEFGLDLNSNNQLTMFVGDSPNDEPMFEFFKNSFGVANVLNFEKQMKTMPRYVSVSSGGDGFAEIVDHILK